MTFGEAIDVLLTGRIMDPSVARLIRPTLIASNGAFAGDTMSRVRMISSALSGDTMHDVAYDLLQLAQLLDHIAADALIEATESGNTLMADNAGRLAQACVVVRQHCRYLNGHVA